MSNKVTPAVDLVGVNSKEKFGIFIFFTMFVSLNILNWIIILFKWIYVDFLPIILEN